MLHCTTVTKAFHANLAATEDHLLFITIDFLQIKWPVVFLLMTNLHKIFWVALVSVVAVQFILELRTPLQSIWPSQLIVFKLVTERLKISSILVSLNSQELTCHYSQFSVAVTL